MADDTQKQDQKDSENSETQIKSEDQNVSKPETQTETTSEPSESPTPSESDTSGTPGSKVAESKPTSKPISANLEKIIEQIEKLSVLELADLVHALEDRFGVSAQAPVATSNVAGAVAGEAASDAEEKTTFNVILTAGGANKIAVIKAVRELVQTLGLKEAKDLVEAAPKPVLESVNKQTAEEAKTKLTAAGGTVELQ